MKIAITGHRPERLNGHEQEIRDWIDEFLLKNEVTVMYNGMADGVDQICAKSAVKNRIPLIICYPYPLIICYPYKRISFNPLEESLMDNAEEINFISKEYSKQSYYIRDKYMVDHCDILLAVWDGKKVGGTWLTVKYAQSIGKEIIFFPQSVLTSC